MCKSVVDPNWAACSNSVPGQPARCTSPTGASARPTSARQHDHQFGEGGEAMEGTLLAIAIGIFLVALVSYGKTTTRLRGIEHKLNALLRHHGVDPTQGLPLSDRVKQLAAD